MASTYSDLKIQLMTTGENATTWGSVTNTNLGTAIEEAIVGSADVTFASGNETLTLSNSNATQTARNLRLNLTGTTGGSTRTLTVPDIQKVYVVNNGCGDAVEVKNSTGSNISVPAGKTMWVYSTGTNVVDVVTHLSSLTLASPLPVASGGTGSNTATFSGANITSLNASAISSGTIANARTTASDSNGASTIVARDGSGNFSANTVTADLTGTAANATVLETARTIGITGGVTGTNTSFDGSANISINVTAMNADVISAGTLANARTTASSSNGASTIVARDASGNFSANTITADLTGTAANATVLETARTIAITGGATGTATSFDGSANVSINVTALNVSTASAGTLGVARGGTGASTLNAEAVVVGNGTSAVKFVAPGTSGNVLTSNGSAWASTALSAGGGISISGNQISIDSASNGFGTRTISTLTPSGGSAGDIWYRVSS